MDIGRKLKEARLQSQKTQDELSHEIHVSRQTISSWENGRSYPDIVSVITLSDLYGISLDELLKGDKKMIENLEKNTNIVKSNTKVILSVIVGIFVIILLGFMRNSRNAAGFYVDNIYINGLILVIFSGLIISYGWLTIKKYYNISMYKPLFITYILISLVYYAFLFIQVFPYIKLKASSEVVEIVLRSATLLISIVLSSISYRLVFKKNKTNK